MIDLLRAWVFRRLMVWMALYEKRHGSSQWENIDPEQAAIHAHSIILEDGTILTFTANTWED